MADFGVQVQREGYLHFHIDPQAYSAIEDYPIESDASAASYFFAAAALCGGWLEVDNLTPKTRQGDLAFLDILSEMGCIVTHEGNAMRISSRGQLKGVDVDMVIGSDELVFGGKMGLDLRQVNRRAIAKIQGFHRDPKRAGHFAPAFAKPSGCQDQDRIASGQHIRDSGLPSAMAIGDIDCRVTRRASDMFEIRNQTMGQLYQFPLINIWAGLMHRAQNALGHDRRARDGKIGTALRQ